MSTFAVTFDRLVRRIRKIKHRYDYRTRQSSQEEYLKSPRNVMPHVKGASSASTPPNRVLFSYHTRYYLRRRAWRYFRRKGFKQPDDYFGTVAKMLSRYTDAFLASGESLLDSWSLMHACFRGSDVLDFGVSEVNVKAGRSLAELQAAPDFEGLWAKPQATVALLSLLSTAQARAVRVWSMQLLRRLHMEHFSSFKPEELLPLLDHSDEEVQAFAAEVLEKLPGMANLDVPTWLKLLQTRNMAALEILTRLMAQHVRPDRLTLDQMVDIANAQPVPVARMGLRFLQQKQFPAPAERAALSRLSNARSAGVAGEITTWALSILGTTENYNVDLVSPFFDSLQEPAREAGWAWLTPQSPGWLDPALWSRLIETPYDDVRFHVVAELERRAKLPGTSVEQVTLVWQSVLLNIHRGGRAKLAALKQISAAIQSDPARAEPLLPVLAVAIRSVRLPEVRTGLSAIVTAVRTHPALADAVAKHLPELQLTAEEVVA